MKVKFKYIIYLSLAILLIAQIAIAVDFPETRSKQNDLFPKPQHNYVAQINPPGFSWLPVKGADHYRFSLKDIESGKTILNVNDIHDNIYVPRIVLKPGEYEWSVTAIKGEKVLAERRPYQLTIPENLLEQPLPDIDALLKDIPDQHSRLIYLKENLPQIKASLKTSRKEMWEILKRTADSCLDMEAPIKPTYEKYDIETQYTLRRLEYQRYYREVRPAIDKAVQALSLAYLLTEEDKYAVAAKRILLEIASWDPHGITSSNHSGFDEVGLSLARCTHRAYDWLYDALSEEEKELVRNNCIERARDTFRRVGIERPFHRRPGSSHDGRLIGYLGEQAIVLLNEAPYEEVKQWLTYSMEAFMTVYPHWGNDDGGWAEGLDYGPRYNMFITPWIEGLRAVSDVDLWQRPFFRSVRNFFTSCTRPNAEHKPFGDGAEINLIESNRHTTGLMVYLLLHSVCHEDPSTFQWLLHTLEPVQKNEKDQQLMSTRKDAWLDVKLFNSENQSLKFIQSDEFDTKYMQDVPDDYLDQITDYWHEVYKRDIDPHYHFKASSVDPVKDLRIAAVMTAGRSARKPEIKWLSAKGWIGAIVTYPDGKAEVWAQLDKEAKQPKKAIFKKNKVDKSASLFGRWHPNEGEDVFFPNESK